MTEPPRPEPPRPDPEKTHRDPLPSPPPGGSPYGPGPWPEHSYGEPAMGSYASAYGPGGYGSGLEYGGRWRRLIAAIIDGLIVYSVTWLVTAPTLGFGTIYEGSAGRQTVANLIAGVVAFLYYVLQHGKWGRTLGKRAMGLCVVRADDGGPISYGQAAWRLLFAYLISLATCGIGGLIDVAWILWDRRRQALHDKVARTVVVGTGPHMPDPYLR